MLDFGFYNMDCMEGMKEFPDKYFDLAIVDPPYGINADEKNNGKNSDRHEKTSLAKINSYKTGWDNSMPDNNYFLELYRTSKHQIIWGANYYGLSGGMIYWKKNVTMPTYSKGEIAFCSLINMVDEFEYTWHGMMQGDMKNKEHRIHPTQKPVQLYRWLLKNYAKEGDKILDTHVGSASSLIACEMEGFKYVGFEIDKEYFDEANKRMKRERSQLKLF